MSALPLRPQVFAILSSLIEERAGLHYGLDDIDMIADKLSTRAIDAGFESLLDYYYFLRYDESSKAELDALVDALVVNETYFFRELDPLKRVVSDLIQPLAASGARPRVWCAACSTGEEPLTLAMLLAERDLLDKVDIVASDISARALARARALMSLATMSTLSSRSRSARSIARVSGSSPVEQAAHQTRGRAPEAASGWMRSETTRFNGSSSRKKYVSLTTSASTSASSSAFDDSSYRRK